MEIRAIVGFGRMRRCIFLVSGIAILAYVVFYKDQSVLLSKKLLKLDSTLNMKKCFKPEKYKDQSVLLSKKLLKPGSTLNKKKSFKPEKIWIPDNYTGIPCNYTLKLPQDKIMEKISSYEFPGIHENIADLFPDSNNQTIPHEPVFLTALSSDHLREGRALISNFKEMAEKHRKRKLIIYDIGLTGAENKQLAAFCECEVPLFPFDDYPDHIGILLGYAWKPIVIQNSKSDTLTNVHRLAKKIA